METLDRQDQPSENLPDLEKPRVSPQIILVLGPELSGKSEQARILSKRTGLPLVGAGGAFRQLQTSYKNKIDSKIEPNDLERRTANLLTDPDNAYSDLQLFEDVMKWRFTQADPIEKFQHGFVLEGAPRTREQFEKFEEIINDLGLEIDIKAVYLTVASYERKERQEHRGEREDDTKLAKRLEDHYKDFKFKRHFAKDKWNLQVVHTTKKDRRQINEEIVDVLELDRPLLLRYREAVITKEQREKLDWLGDGAMEDIMYDVLNAPRKDREGIINAYQKARTESTEGLGGDNSWEEIERIQEFLNNEMIKMSKEPWSLE